MGRLPGGDVMPSGWLNHTREEAQKRAIQANKKAARKRDAEMEVIATLRKVLSPEAFKQALELREFAHTGLDPSVIFDFGVQGTKSIYQRHKTKNNRNKLRDKQGTSQRMRKEKTRGKI